MSKVRVLVGTRKGAFILTSDGARKRWKVSGPHFAGWEIYHMKGSPVNPDRIYASQTSGWFGQIIQRSDDGGKTWNTPGSSPEELKSADGTPKGESNKFVYDTSPETGNRSRPTNGTTAHSIHGNSNASGIWNRRSTIPITFMQAWKMPRCSNRKTAGNRGTNWPDCAAAIPVRNGSPARAACVCTPFFSIRAIRIEFPLRSPLPGTFRTDDGGKTWKPINRGLHSQFLPDPTAEVGHCVHRIAFHPSRPNTLFMQKHWDVMRSDNGGDSWQEVSGNLPS